MLKIKLFPLLFYFLESLDGYGTAFIHFLSGSIEWFIKDPGFLLSYDLSPPPSPPVSKLDWQQQHTERQRNRDNLLMGRGKGVGEEPNHTTARIARPL